MKNNYFTNNEIHSKAVSKDVEPVFCATYKDKIRLACATNNRGTNHLHIVRVGGKLSVIILN